MKASLERHPAVRSILASLLAILLGLLVGFVILIFSNPAMATNGFSAILIGGFNQGMRSIGQVLYMAVPIAMTGLAFAFAAKAGMFNIGGSGQFIVGAFAAIYANVNLANVLPKSVNWFVSLLAAMAAGAVWASLPGALKALANVNEVISCIMMNYIGMYIVNMLIVRSDIYDSTKNLTVSPRSFVPTVGLDKLFPSSGANLGIFIALFFCILCFVILRSTVFGYELKVCGLNRYAGKYAGINETRGIILSMTIAGAFAGAGGALMYLSNTGTYISVVDTLASQGFDGIPVALLAMNNPLGVFFTALFIAHLRVGSLYIQRYGFVPEIVEIVIAVIIYCSALSATFSQALANRHRDKKKGADFPKEATQP